MNDSPYGQTKIDATVLGARVKLCITEEEGMCGKYSKAEIVEVREYSVFQSAGIPQGGVIAIVIVVVIIAIAGLSFVVKCCFCNKPNKPKKLTKEDIAGPNRVQTNHNNFNYGLDNKGVDTAKDADSPDLIKSQMYGYNYPSAPAPQVPNTYDSTSNSNNGGSVNSQVSLILVMFRAILKQFIKTVWSADKSEGCHLVRSAICYPLSLSVRELDSACD